MLAAREWHSRLVGVGTSGVCEWHSWLVGVGVGSTCEWRLQAVLAAGACL